MDGYAVRSADLTTGSAALVVIDIITAGQTSTKRIESGQAIQIMTGAPIPDGADAVVKVEDTARDGERVSIHAKPLSSGVNLVRQGTSVRAGDCVLRTGLTLNGACIGALAELGCAIFRFDVVPISRSLQQVTNWCRSKKHRDRVKFETRTNRCWRHKSYPLGESPYRSASPAMIAMNCGREFSKDCNPICLCCRGVFRRESWISYRAFSPRRVCEKSFTRLR